MVSRKTLIFHFQFIDSSYASSSDEYWMGEGPTRWVNYGYQNLNGWEKEWDTEGDTSDMTRVITKIKTAYQQSNYLFDPKNHEVFKSFTFWPKNNLLNICW